MTGKDIKTLLFLDSSKTKCSFSLLFHCARYYAQQGSRVLFISQSPEQYFPLAIGKIDKSLNPDAFKLIQFMYLANWQDLLQQLYSIHLRHNPVSVIIVKNLQSYLKTELQNNDQASLICGSLLYAATICSRITKLPITLVCDYVSEDSTIEKNIVKNFFHSVWKIQIVEEKIEKTVIKLINLSPVDSDKVVAYTFSENFNQSLLEFTEVIKKLVCT